MSSRSDKKQNKAKDTGFTCPECGSKEVVQDLEKGERICSACGLVVSEHRIDHGPEWRAFTADEKDARSRAGAPTNYAIHDKGLSTMIDWRDHDSQGKRFSAKKRSEIYRLRKWQIRTRVHSSVDRNLAQAMSELDRLYQGTGCITIQKTNHSTTCTEQVNRRDGWSFNLCCLPPAKSTTLPGRNC